MAGLLFFLKLLTLLHFIAVLLFGGLLLLLLFILILWQIFFLNFFLVLHATRILTIVVSIVIFELLHLGDVGCSDSLQEFLVFFEQVVLVEVLVVALDDIFHALVVLESETLAPHVLEVDHAPVVREHVGQPGCAFVEINLAAH